MTYKEKVELADFQISHALFLRWLDPSKHAAEIAELEEYARQWRESARNMPIWWAA